MLGTVGGDEAGRLAQDGAVDGKDACRDSGCEKAASAIRLASLPGVKRRLGRRRVRAGASGKEPSP